MRKNGQIDYVEFPGRDIARMARFYGGVFGWTFEGRDDRCKTPQGEGAEAALSSNQSVNAWQPLVMLYVVDLDAARLRVEAAGGQILRPIFPHAGGWRFHFRDPEGNELGVWSDVPISPTPSPIRGLRDAFAGLWGRPKPPVEGPWRDPGPAPGQPLLPGPKRPGPLTSRRAALEQMRNLREA